MTAAEMSAGELAVVLAAVLCCIGFAALVVVLMRVLDTLRSLRTEVATLRAETGPLLAELQQSTRTATAVVETRHVTTSSGSTGCSARPRRSAMPCRATGRVTRAALSTPVIKTAAFATGTSRAVRRLRGKEPKGARSGVRDGSIERGGAA